ncbi:MAG: methyltransferase domain-containing protein [Candidatus Binatia bacterium]
MEHPRREAPIQDPSPRRRRRISVYKAVVGQGHGQILELGCGSGDLTYALADHANKIVGIDIALENLELAKMRRHRRPIAKDQAPKITFIQMSAVNLGFTSETFDYAVSTSMIEHLHPDDVQPHLREVWRVLKPGGRYLVWCPNRLGHHKDLDVHLSMHSMGEWIKRMRISGFREFQSPLFNRPPMVNARFKVLLEKTLSTLRIKILWSHLGVRNILLVAEK